MTSPAQAWAAWLQDVLDDRGWTRHRLATALEVHQSRVSAWLAGQHSPTVNTVLHAARTLGADELDLLERMGHPSIAQWARELRSPDTERHSREDAQRREDATERAGLVDDVLESLARITSVLDDATEDLGRLREGLASEGGTRVDKGVQTRSSPASDRSRGA